MHFVVVYPSGLGILMSTKGNKMKFQKTTEYWTRKINGIKSGIAGTQKNLASLTVQKEIDAHIEQIKTYKKDLDQAQAEYKEWALNHG
jgi:hypothetical protein